MGHPLIVRVGLVLVLSGLAGACEQPAWRGLAAEGAGPAGPGKSRDPVPDVPPWLRSIEGKTLAAVFSRQTQCIGNAEAVALTYLGPPGGAKIVGWGWAVRGRMSPPRVILVDGGSNIVGGGESGLERLDVPTAVPAVTSSTTGWWALTTRTHGRLDAYGLFPVRRTICKLGHVDL